jgi:Fe-S-cluster containining protein
VSIAGEIHIPEAFELLVEQAEDRIKRRLQGLPGGGREVSCREGCAACCRQLVVVSPLEALAIRAWVDARPELAPGLGAAHERHAGQVAGRPSLATALAALDEVGGKPEPEVAGALEVAYFSASLPCPFLRDERCGIYPVRPFACREHFALSEPTLCAIDPDRVVAPDTRVEFKTVAAIAGSRAFGLADRFVALPRALEYARAQAASPGVHRADRSRFLAIAAIAERQVRGALAGLVARKKESTARGDNGSPT